MKNNVILSSITELKPYIFFYSVVFYICQCFHMMWRTKLIILRPIHADSVYTKDFLHISFLFAFLKKKNRYILYIVVSEKLVPTCLLHIH